MFFVYLVWSVIIAVCFAYINSYIKHRRQYKLLKNLPGTPPIPLFGNTTWAIRIYSQAKTMKYHPGVYIAERIMGSSLIYPKTGMYVFWMGPEPVVPVYRAEIVEQIFSSTISIEKSYEYNFLHSWLGTGLLTSTGSKWKERRRLLTPSFHFRILEDFLPVFNQQSLNLVQNLKSMVNEKYVNITPLIVFFTLDVICETVMGVSIGAQKGDNLDYVQAIHNLAHSFNQRVVAPWFWNDFIYGLSSKGKGYNRDVKLLHDFTDKVIQERKKEILSARNSQKMEEMNEEEYFGKKRRTFMDLLLDMHINGQQLSETDIREEVDTFMFEGHDTTAMGITFALYFIGLYPDVQKKIIQEIDDIFGTDTERPVNLDDIRKMKYLECTLKESQRLFPSVPIIGRKLDEDIHFADLIIPKDTTVHCSLLSLHRDPEFFPNPEVFDPERFLPENSSSRHPYAYIPFSAGPRNCIGQKFAMLEEKTLICTILRHFYVISLDQRDKFHIKVEFTLRPAQDVRLKFVPRR